MKNRKQFIRYNRLSFEELKKALNNKNIYPVNLVFRDIDTERDKVKEERKLLRKKEDVIRNIEEGLNQKIKKDQLITLNLITKNGFVYHISPLGIVSYKESFWNGERR